MQDETAKRLAEIDARVEAATKGPWELREHEGLSAIAHPTGFVLEDDYDADMRDRRFIAHARTDIPWLRTQLDAMREERDAASAAEDERADACERATAERDEARGAALAAVKQRNELVSAIDEARDVRPVGSSRTDGATPASVLACRIVKTQATADVYREERDEARAQLAALAEAAECVVAAHGRVVQSVPRSKDKDEWLLSMIRALAEHGKVRR